MTNIKRALFGMVLFFVGCSSLAQSLEGRWRVSKTFFYPHLGFFRENMTETWIEFSKDSITSPLGFYFLIIKESEDIPYATYPFVYYGEKEKYWITNDSLYIGVSPLKKWYSYKLEKASNHKYKLRSKIYGDTFLERVPKPKLRKLEIVSIKIRVREADSRPGYTVTLTQDSLLLEDLSNSPTTIERYPIPHELFKSICRRFNEFDLYSLKSDYESDFTHASSTEVRINLKDGYSILTNLWGSQGSEALWLACIPVIYSYHLFKYKDAKPVE